ncbi:MAG: ROK family protein [Bacteroidales bacterium]|nr:MAG: ROK family protein [Bacteroidales bacterium]
MLKDKIIGIDIGGTKISAGFISDNAIVKRVTIDTEANKSQDEIIQNIFTAIDRVWQADVKGIGVGVPGLVDHENGIVYHLQNIPSWQEVKLKEYLELRYFVPTFINNDASCFALGEKYFGVGRRFSNFVGITLGTGVGSGIIINNKLYSGSFSGAGEFGSIPYKDSNFEKYCSGQFFERCYGVTGQEAFQKANKGDKKALEIWHEFGQNLGEFIHVIMFSLAPDAVVIGGSISAGFGLFKQSMNESINRFPFAKVKSKFKVECSQNPDIAIMGAGALYFNSISLMECKSVLSDK